MNIFDYLDYRILLKDLYQERKKVAPFFSYRYICQKVGFASAGFFANILNNKRNISDDIIFKLADLFRFSKQETEYFEDLVHFCQSVETGRKQYYFEKMVSMRRSTVAELTAEQNEYFMRWYYVAIRELINFYPFDGDYQRLASMLVPKISAQQAEEAITLLLKLGLIKKDGDKYCVTDKTITSGHHVSIASINAFQRDTIEIARTSVDRYDRDERSISTLTLSVSGDMYKKIEKKLSHFRRDLLEMVKNDPQKIERVYQLNFQLFPLTKKPDTDNS